MALTKVVFKNEKGSFLTVILQGKRIKNKQLDREYLNLVACW